MIGFDDTRFDVAKHLFIANLRFDTALSRGWLDRRRQRRIEGDRRGVAAHMTI